MKRKILKGVLILACQFVLMTGVSFASDTNEAYFNLKTFEDVSSEIEGKVEKKYLDIIEKEYDEVYKLEKEMKYFNADKKWDDIWDLTDEIEDWFVEEDDEAEEAVEEFQEYIEDIERDYRYGILSFEEAYEFELKEFVNLIPTDKREKFKEVLKEKYEEMETAYEKYVDQGELRDSKNKEENLQLFYEFIKIRREIASLIKAANRPHNLVITENDVYNISSVCFEPEKFNEFLKEEEVIKVIGKKNIGKLRNLSKEAMKAENDIDTDDVLDEIEEMLYDFFNPQKKDYKGKSREDIELINKLYDEIEEE